jgi:Uma2 family endonuclease
MVSAVTSERVFEPGTTGWTAHDLDDPRIERQWLSGRYEIVEGVLATMPPAYFLGGRALFELMVIVRNHLAGRGTPAEFSTEVEIIIDDTRVARCDAALLTPQDEEAQIAASKAAGRQDPDRTRILVPPTLIIESVSPGHELHDERTKMRWYAEIGVPNYWIVDAFARTLRCFVLDQSAYLLDVSGSGETEIRPSCFAGLIIPLSQLWKLKEKPPGARRPGIK